MTPGFSYQRAASIKDAVTGLSTGKARILAGGTDLLGCLRDNVFTTDMVVSITGIKDLKRIHETPGGGLSIGSLTTITEISESPVIRERYPALAQAAAEVASPQLRNQGTIGGNLCQKPRCWYYRGEFHCLRKSGDRCYAVAGENHYHCIFGGNGCYIVHPSDTAPALIAYRAEAAIAGPVGMRKVSLEHFFVPPSKDVTKETVLEAGEIVTEIVLPPPPAGLKSSYRKIRARRSWDFALAGVALAVQTSNNRVADARIVLSGAAPVPWRLVDAEKALIGKVPGPDSARQTAALSVKDAQPLKHNAYKIPLFRGMIEEELTNISKA
ncbi:MAG: xanthine dehydrogenase family protein subunit M [Nitrospirae bacterium]|nr:xanthine dehydrogenase family protein subunit M [Nitrospirota bacterium]